MNYRKSEFGLIKATFLGFTLSADGSVLVEEDVLETLTRKLKDILASTMLETDPKKKAQFILGTLNYFREFIYNFSEKVAFITAFLKKTNEDAKWTTKEEDKLTKIVMELRNSGRILPIVPNLDFIVQYDASGIGIA